MVIPVKALPRVGSKLDRVKVSVNGTAVVGVVWEYETVPASRLEALHASTSATLLNITFIAYPPLIPNSLMVAL